MSARKLIANSIFSDLIDVQSTDLPTLHGKPSFEFANLLNKHYDNETNGKISHKQQNMEDSHISTTSHEEPTTLDIPTTPVLNNHNVFGRLQDDNNEPPSPFTQAQLQAAEKLLNTQSQNQQTISSNRSTHEFDSRRTSSALSKTHPESNHIDGLISSTERRTSKETNGDRRETAHQMPEKKDDEDEDEDAWLASVVNGDDVTEIKGLSDVKYRFPDAEGFASDKHGTTTTKKSRAL